MKNLYLFCFLFIFSFFVSCEKEEKWVDIPEHLHVEFANLPLSQIQEFATGKWYLVQIFNDKNGYSEKYTRENSPQILILEKERYLRINHHISDPEWISISWQKYKTAYYAEPVYCLFYKETNDILYHPQKISNGRLVLKDDFYLGVTYYYRRL